MGFSCCTTEASGRLVGLILITGTFISVLLRRASNPTQISLLRASTSLSSSSEGSDGSTSVNLAYLDYLKSCQPGEFRGPDQLQYSTWTTKFLSRRVSIPLYMSKSLNDRDAAVTKAILIQHGNLRNANAYFCGIVSSFLDAVELDEDRSRYIFIAPQFLIDDDVCWDIDSNERRTVRVSEGTTCGYEIFNSEGWKDGQSSLSSASSSDATTFYSYDVYNLILSRLGDGVVFPSLEEVVLVGFSAGAQVLLRYSFVPDFIAANSRMRVRYVVSDPSTYLYLDHLRYHPDKATLGPPDMTWLANWTVIDF